MAEAGTATELSHEISSGCPIVRIEQAWIARRLPDQPPGAFDWGCLHEQLLWLRQTIAQALVLRGEHLEMCVREGKTHVDREGLFESIFGPRGNALLDALTFSQDRAIIGDPSLEVVVLFIVQDVPVRIDSRAETVRWNRSNERCKRYRDVPKNWYYGDTEILTRLLNLAMGMSPSAAPVQTESGGLQPDPIPEPTMAAANTPLTRELLEDRLRLIKVREAFPPAVIWRSSNTNDANQRLAGAMRDRVVQATSSLALPLPLGDA